jgi:hypothetical protein
MVLWWVDPADPPFTRLLASTTFASSCISVEISLLPFSPMQLAIRHAATSAVRYKHTFHTPYDCLLRL